MGYGGWWVTPYPLVLLQGCIQWVGVSPTGQPNGEDGFASSSNYSDETDLLGSFSPGCQQSCWPWWQRVSAVVDGQS